MDTRNYVVSRWLRTKCKDNCHAFREEGRCAHQRSFPIPHLVSLTIEGSKVTGTTCRKGKRAGGARCRDDGPDDRCQHIAMATAQVMGELDPEEFKGMSIDLSAAYTSRGSTVPKCPNCHQKWGVTVIGGGRFSCRSPVCLREDRMGWEQPFEFEKGDGKLAPKRGEDRKSVV